MSEGLRQKVLEKARELGYKMADSARFREEESWCIGIIVAERYIKEYPSFYMEVYRQIAGILTRRGNQTVLELFSFPLHSSFLQCELRSPLFYCA